MASIHANVVPYLSFNHFQTPPSSCLVGSGIVQHGVSLSNYRRKVPCIKCEKKDDEEIQHVSVERPPYYSYLDSTSGQLEPASGARASILGQEYWPEGTASRMRAARAPAPTAESSTSPMSPSYGAKPGSRRKNYKTTPTEQERLERDGPIAYYSEWVNAWKRDTSGKAILKHFEETGEDETTQLIEMFCHGTDREYRILIGTDV
ncbi:hypothetical protein JHK84_042066 [Glycine max]|nr:hypothetical protein JHK84_042066 [Glycine max]